MQKHLKPVHKTLDVTFWADERIKPGEKWSDSIAGAIEAASIHLLIVSPGFLASDYILDVELPAIMKKYAHGDLVLPVIARRCMWQPFISVLQAMPTERGRLVPVCEWKPQDIGFDRVREQAVQAICAHLGVDPALHFDWSSS